MNSRSIKSGLMVKQIVRHYRLNGGMITSMEKGYEAKSGDF